MMWLVGKAGTFWKRSGNIDGDDDFNRLLPEKKGCWVIIGYRTFHKRLLELLLLIRGSAVRQNVINSTQHANATRLYYSESFL